MELRFDQDDSIEKFPEHIILMRVICVCNMAQLHFRILIDDGLRILC